MRYAEAVEAEPMSCTRTHHSADTV